jgi:hypothetical protein
MRALHRIVVVVLLLGLMSVAGFLSDASAQYPAKCDQDKSCVGNALTIVATQGKGAQYVDVDTSYILRALDTALTFEAWLSPQMQPGKKQFVAGLWGPNQDNNDQWLVWIQDNTVTFELNHDGTYLGEIDNTIATTSVPDLYTRGWVHLAAVWDGVTTTARLYLDGALVAVGTNAAYPITHLHPIESATLAMQIASCNSLYDDTSRYRTFKGQMDEIRLWDRALSAQEIGCQRLLSLNGNEPGLIMYLRCNEKANAQFLCDATGNLTSRPRSGANLVASNRVIPSTFTAVPATLSATLACTADTIFTITVTDTSLCGDQVNVGLDGANANNFTVSANNLMLAQNVPQTITVTLKGNPTGVLAASLNIVSQNRCGNPIRIPINVNRTTQLSYSVTSIAFDTLYVGCEEVLFETDTVTICNTTGSPISISGATFDSSHFTWSPGAGSPKLPTSLAPGACYKLVVRYDQQDTSVTFFDTLRVHSSDVCPGSGIIPVTGRSQEVIALLATDGKSIVDTLAFGSVCPDQISAVGLYQYRGLVSDTVYIDSITYTDPHFFGAGFQFPVKLVPKTAYLATYIRFKPTAAGPLSGMMHLYSHYHGCTIEKSIGLWGRGISVNFAFNQTQLSFGNVTIGKAAQLVATVTNHGVDSRNLAAYLKVGDVFQIIAGSSFSLNPGQTANITVEFRPRQLLNYVDTLAVFDEGCYSTIEIPVSGTGVFQSLSFTPPYLPIQNVVGCQCQTDTVLVKNISGTNLSITAEALNDPSGKMTIVSPSHVGPLASNATVQYIVTYCPNDLTHDRADDAYIDITLSDGEQYQLLVRATSLAPELYVTPLTTYNIVEVGWQKLDSILLENASPVPVHVSSITVPPGYSIVSTSPPLPVTLNPRDSLWVYVLFQPTSETGYDGNITATLDGPCPQTYSGVITGAGQIVKLDVPITFMNYSLIKPCDCEIRKIPLPNYSFKVPISIDSIWIDAVGLPNPWPQVFSWSSDLSGTKIPYQIPAQGEDTLLISFCPNIPATQANTVLNATLHIKASSPGWSQVFNTLMSGGRELNFQPSTVLVGFPATRVDTSAAPIGVNIAVPNPFVNPSGDSVIIDSIGFMPDDHVFSVLAANNAPLPWVIHRNQTFAVNVTFLPRAPITYIARMLLYTSYPCDGIDTSILVEGTGFAPAFGLQMAFDTAKIGHDTLTLNTCDTLVLPIMINRDIPQNIIDIMFRLGYDTAALKLVGISSKYTGAASIYDSTDGAHATLKNAIKVLQGPIAYVKFVVHGGPTKFPISLDSIYFSSDSLVFFKIVAGNDKGYINIDQPQISISPLTSFDTVNVRSCDSQVVTVSNPGLIPVRFDSLTGLPRWHRITSSSKPLPVILNPGQSVQVTVTFCPRAEGAIDTTLAAISNSPCPILDTGKLHSYGYAPPFPLTLLIGGSLVTIDSVRGAIDDTISVPMLIDRDFPVTPIDLNYSLVYNRRSLEYLSATSTYTKPVVTQSNTGLLVQLPGCDSVKKGEIARLKFVVAVPDSIVTRMMLVPQTFTSDSELWVKPLATGDTTTVIVDPQCNISRLNFVGGKNSISQPIPNPSTGRVTLNVEFVEDGYPNLRIYDESGDEVVRPVDGTTYLKGGKYSFDLNLMHLSTGTYYVRFEAGSFHDTRKMVIMR